MTSLLAEHTEEAIRKDESLKSLTTDNFWKDVARDKIMQDKEKIAKLVSVKSKEQD